MTSPDGVRIGCGSGFWGDAFDPAEELLRGGELEYLGFDFLAELTMALLQRLRAKNPDAGFVEDAVQFMADLAAPARERGTVLVSNGGGVNPEAGARAIVARLAAKGLSGIRVGTVAGDDLLPRIDELLAAGIPLANSVTGDTDLERIRSRIVCAKRSADRASRPPSSSSTMNRSGDATRATSAAAAARSPPLKVPRLRSMRARSTAASRAHRSICERISSVGTCRDSSGSAASSSRSGNA